jgi:hypothetical protein
VTRSASCCSSTDGGGRIDGEDTDGWARLTHLDERGSRAHGRRRRQGRHRAHGRRDVPRSSSRRRRRRCSPTARCPRATRSRSRASRASRRRSARRELIPLCHQVALTGVTVDLDVDRERRRHDHGHRSRPRPHRRRDGGADRRVHRGAHRLRPREGRPARRGDHGLRLVRKTGGRSGDVGPSCRRTDAVAPPRPTRGRLRGAPTPVTRVPAGPRTAPGTRRGRGGRADGADHWRRWPGASGEPSLLLLILVWVAILLPGALRSRLRPSPRATVGGFQRTMDGLRVQQPSCARAPASSPRRAVRIRWSSAAVGFPAAARRHRPRDSSSHRCSAARVGARRVAHGHVARDALVLRRSRSSATPPVRCSCRSTCAVPPSRSSTRSPASSSSRRAARPPACACRRGGADRTGAGADGRQRPGATLRDPSGV